MTQTRQELVNRISRLPAEKLNIVMTFIHFIEQQKESVLFAEPVTNDINNINNTAKKPFSEMRGIFKGKIWMSDDFNEPLEEMKEYME